MGSLSQRMRKLQEKLLAIRLGSGAAVLPKEVKRIHLQFARLTGGGHLGARIFWRQELVRLKYHNPAVTMTVERTSEPRGPATMSIYFASDSAAQTASGSMAADVDGEATERVEKINMKNYRSSEIMEAVTALTKAYPVEPTPDDQEELEKLGEHKRRSEKDSKLSQEVRARVKREKELLEQARGDLAAQTA